MTENELIMLVAMSQIGVRETTGEDHNPEVLKYFNDTGHSWVKDDETAWCSAFMNWVAKYALCESSGKLNARSWLTVGEWVMPDKYIEGDVCVFWRESPDSWKGHVGIYFGEDDHMIYVLGGNQGNTVCIKPYPKSRLLSVRRLSVK